MALTLLSVGADLGDRNPRINKIYQIITSLMGKINKNSTSIQVMFYQILLFYGLFMIKKNMSLCLNVKGVVVHALHLLEGVEKPSVRVTYIVVLEGLS